MAASAASRLNAALREIGKLSALVDSLREQLHESQVELAEARSTVETYRRGADGASASRSTHDNQIRALQFQIIQERKRHEAVIEKFDSHLHDQREEISELRRRGDAASQSASLLSSTVLRACDEAQEHMHIIQTALAAIGVLTMPSIQPCVHGLDSVLSRLRGRACEHSGADITVDSRVSDIPIATNVSQPNLSVISAETHIRKVRKDAAAPTVSMRKGSGRAVSASASARRSATVAPKVSTAKAATTTSLSPTGQENLVRSQPSSELLRTICGDLTKENQRLRLEIQSLQESAKQTQQSIVKLQTSADAAKRNEYAISACRDHAAILEAKVMQQDAQLHASQEIIRDLRAELQQAAMQKDDAMQRLEYAMRRQTLLPTNESIGVLATAGLTAGAKRTMTTATTATLKSPISASPPEPQRRQSLSSTISSASKVSVTGHRHSHIKSPPANAQSRRAAHALREPPQRTVARKQPGPSPRAHTTRQQSISPSTLSTSATDSTATTDFLRHVNEIVNTSSLAPISSPAVTQEVFREVLQRTLDVSAEQAPSHRATSRSPQGRSAAGDPVLSSNVRNSNILVQLRTMDAELEELKKQSAELHTRAQRSTRGSRRKDSLNPSEFSGWSSRVTEISSIGSVASEREVEAAHKWAAPGIISPDSLVHSPSSTGGPSQQSGVRRAGSDSSANQDFRNLQMSWISDD